MKMPILEKKNNTRQYPVVSGNIRVDRRTKNLVRRLKRGEIAVIYHEDIDGLAARALVNAGVIAVINAVSSSTGRYPNSGPAILLDAGIILIDDVGEEFYSTLKDGMKAEIIQNKVTVEANTANGKLIDKNIAKLWLTIGQENIGRELAGFAKNTLERLDSEWRLFFDPLIIPDLKTKIRDKHVVVVTRGSNYESDITAILSYIYETKPIIIAVDGAADYLLLNKIKPHLLVGDMDSVSDKALNCGAEIIAHGYIDDRPSKGVERCELLGLKPKVLKAPGTSEDLAMLIAYELGAKLIVAVGTHFSLEEFLDKGRSGMASTFLTRLKTGAKLVDAKGVSRLYTKRPAGWDYLFIITAALFTISTAAFLSPFGQMIISLIKTWFRLHIK